MQIKKRHSFYLVPHPDDWLFFCTSQVNSDLQAGNRVTFIFVTAGDAGLDENWWKAREKGVLAALYSHLTTCYFLRLPDGMEQGTGSILYHYQSLTQLQKHNSPIHSLDGSKTYSTWLQFCDELATIIQTESQNIDPDTIWIHAPEYDIEKNPNDHPDHIAISQAVRTIAEGNYNISWWLSYWSYYCPPNLSQKELIDKRNLFLTYSKEVEKLTGIAPNEQEWDCWGDRNHFREILKNGKEQKSYDPRCPKLEQFYGVKPMTQGVQYQRSFATVEEKGARIQNRFTGEPALLTPVGQKIWQRLKNPITSEEIAEILTAANPKISSEKHKKDADYLLSAFLKMKLIYRI